LYGHNKLANLAKPIKVDYLKISHLEIPDTLTEIPFEVTYFIGVPDDIDSTKKFTKLEHLVNYEFLNPYTEIVLGEDGHELIQANPPPSRSYMEPLKKMFGAKSYDLILRICSCAITNLTIKVNDSVTNSLDQLNISILVHPPSSCSYSSGSLTLKESYFAKNNVEFPYKKHFLGKHNMNLNDDQFKVKSSSFLSLESDKETVLNVEFDPNQLINSNIKEFLTFNYPAYNLTVNNISILSDYFTITTYENLPFEIPSDSYTDSPSNQNEVSIGLIVGIIVGVVIIVIIIVVVIIMIKKKNSNDDNDFNP
jgi:hypothetical protein